MLYHELGLVDLIDCMEVMIREDLGSSETRQKLQDLFEAWEYGVGFLGGQIWPCFEEYRDNEYASDPGKEYLLISVFEREISTEPFPSLNAARHAMLAELKAEFLKENIEAEWDEIMAHDAFECDSFGFGECSAWSNLDDDCNCDWRIVTLPPVITE